MKNVREPVRIKWIWPVLVAIILLGVPWYLPQGSIEPIIMGFPYWAFISFIMTIALSLFLGYVILNCWSMESLLDDESGNTKAGGGRK
ncbi:MAG TPA: hypothetical protein GXX30_01765 [Firmicutes bacterium]|nr:hypothetical protein [Candidatus Fermentithermobacillaceae bacterium]